jgi:peptidoglycan L-alanyl-D-glutamate endopeptidase CwlK
MAGSNFRLGRSSERILRTVEDHLQRVVRRALYESRVDFSVISGLRTLEEQQELYAQGRTKPGKIITWVDGVYQVSNHQAGLAVDLYPWVDGKTSHDPDHYKAVARAMFYSSQVLGFPVAWGGLWTGEQEDLPHWELVL